MFPRFILTVIIHSVITLAAYSFVHEAYLVLQRQQKLREMLLPTSVVVTIK